MWLPGYLKITVAMCLIFLSDSAAVEISTMI